MTSIKLLKVRSFKDTMLFKVSEADATYGREDKDIWKGIKFMALQRKIADSRLTLKDMEDIQAYVEVEYPPYRPYARSN